MDWFRWYHGTADDPKWRVVSRRAGRPVYAVLAVWAKMLETASQARPRGTLAGWNDEVVAAGLDMETEAVAAIREAMQGLVLDGDVLTGWAGRQPVREDSSAERTRAYRQRLRAAAGGTAVTAGTQRDAPVTQRDAAVTPRGEEMRGEERYTPPPPPPPHPRAHAHEASPDAAGTSGGQHAAAAQMSAPEWLGTMASADPERTSLIGEMLAAIEERARDIEDGRRRRRFVARSRMIVSGDDVTAWQDGAGTSAPWADRPRLLRLALARTAGEDEPDLRSALRYVVAQQLDPFRPPRSTAPPPGSEASRVRDELPREGGARTGELERVGSAPYGPPDDERRDGRWDALIERWEAEHPEEAAALRERVAREIAESPLGQGLAGRAMLRTLVRSKFRLAVRALLEREQPGEPAMEAV